MRPLSSLRCPFSPAITLVGGNQLIPTGYYPNLKLLRGIGQVQIPAWDHVTSALRILRKLRDDMEIMEEILSRCLVKYAIFLDFQSLILWSGELIVFPSDCRWYCGSLILYLLYQYSGTFMPFKIFYLLFPLFITERIKQIVAMFIELIVAMYRFFLDFISC